jgi:hypothetical protein
MNSDVDVVITKPPHFRFSGCVTRIGPEFAFLRLDNLLVDVFLHRRICDETVPFDTLNVGDRLRFGLKPSTMLSGKFVASRPARETKI